jgi:hypothetical protein
MFSSKRMLLTITLVVGLLVGGLAGFTFAQVRPPFTSGHVFSGDEIGFRVDGMIYGQPARATLLIKIDGQWREFQPNIDVTPLAR